MSAAHPKPSMSPATAASATERRQFPRSAFGEEVTVLWAGPPITGIVRDVSDRGMSFSVDRASGTNRFAVGSRLRLTFTAPESEGDSGPVNVIGEVVRLSSEDEGDRIVVAVAFQRL